MAQTERNHIALLGCRERFSMEVQLAATPVTMSDLEDLEVGTLLMADGGGRLAVLSPEHTDLFLETGADKTYTAVHVDNVPPFPYRVIQPRTRE